MTTLVIGAAGQIGRQIVEKLIAQGETPRAMVRRACPELQAAGAEIYLADLEEDFSRALNGCHKVVFTAGSGAKTGADKTILVDMWGAIKAVDFAGAQGVEQFVMISSRGADNPEQGPAAIKHYAVCKKMADDYLLKSGVPYTILRPGRLLNEPATGGFSTTMPEEKDAQVITRADVADAAVYCLNHEQTLDRIYPLVNGDQPLSSALT